MSLPIVHRGEDLTGVDFSGVDLSSGNLAHSTLTGCKFGNCIGTNFNCCKGSAIDFTSADISGATFEKAEASVLACLVGATWNEVPITTVSNWITSSGMYWAFATNAFVQIGCMQKTLAEWQELGQSLETLSALLVEQPLIDIPATFAWWNDNREAVELVAETCING